MKNKHRTAKGKASVGKGILCGIFLALTVSFFCIAVITAIVLNGRASEITAEYVINGVQFTSVLLASLTGVKMVGDKRAQICISVTGVYELILTTINIFFFNSDFRRALLSCTMMVLGGGAACVLCLKEGRKSRKHKIYNC